MSPSKHKTPKAMKGLEKRVFLSLYNSRDSDSENLDSNIIASDLDPNASSEPESKKRKASDCRSPENVLVPVKKSHHCSTNAIRAVGNSIKGVLQIHEAKPNVMAEKKVPSDIFSAPISHSTVKVSSNIFDDSILLNDTVNNFKHVEEDIVGHNKNLSKSSNRNFDFVDQDLDAFFQDDFYLENELDFSSFKRCQVMHLILEGKALILTLQEQITESSGVVKCFGFWREVNVEKDNIVTILAIKKSNEWIVDNAYGFVIINPDLLIPITTIVGGIFCNRRAVLAEKFRKIEYLPSTGPYQTAMATGSLIHQLLQKVCQDVPIEELKRPMFKETDVQTSLDSILSSMDTINLLYSCDLSMAQARKEVASYVPEIFTFIKHYVQGVKQKSVIAKKENYQGCITDIRDIEENIWVPMLGMKGKIDMTVQVNIHGRKRVLPLEVKSGRTTFSLEHQGQVILYVMMMALLDADVDSGLLLYLKDISVREIKKGHCEKRDLVLLRNTLASYFMYQSSKELSTLKLPPPINHRSACTKCSFNNLCCAYLSKDAKSSLPDSHPVKELSQDLFRHITSDHIDYVTKWVSLMQMEENAQSEPSSFSKLWTLPPEKREKIGSCISNLKVIKVTKCSDRYEHIFVRVNPARESTKLPFLDFTGNEYVLVSKDDRLNISTGYIAALQQSSVTVLLDRNITKRFSSALFHIDKYTFAGQHLSCYANVGGLLNNDSTSQRLREIVIERKPATFKTGMSLSSLKLSEQKLLRQLNKNQRMAILKVLSANDYVIIKGMPGTGKTQTLVVLIRLLVKLGKSVLVTAHTHSAVDNILMKLVEENVDVLRLGLATSIDPRLVSKSEEHVTANCRSPEALSATYRSKKIVGVTCLGAYHSLLTKEMFDVCIVDESAQITQPEVLRPLYNARIFVLAGDPDQLPAVIKSKAARRLGADESLFVRLDSENNTAILDLQYRMNERIMSLANNLTYNGQLKAGNNSVESATLTSSVCMDEASILDDDWLKAALSMKIEDSIILLDTGATNDLILPEYFADNGFADSDQMYSNIWEAAIAARLVKTLLKMGSLGKDIGIIAPYRAQVLLLQKYLGEKVEVNTVDQYQGRDKNVIIYTCARSTTVQMEKARDLEILEDHRRLTVAVTRAKRKLIIIADKSTVSRYTPFRKLFHYLQDEHTVCMWNSDSQLNYDKFVKILSYLR